MSYLYLEENGVIIGVDANRLTLKYQDGLMRSIPIETVDGIVIIGRDQLTAHCMQVCMEKGIPVSFMSKGGRYFGRLMSTGHVKASLQRQQSKLYDTAFAVELSKRIVTAKINNQIIVLKRYSRNKGIDVRKYVFNMKNSKKKIEFAEEIKQISGYEGIAARSYYEGLSDCIDEKFRFKGRSRRPPVDEFNSLISFGYSILMNEIYCEIENHGLNPYFGFMHRDSENHPTLASDMMEEWRAVIVDSLAMSLINGHEVSKEDFSINVDEPGCFLTKQCLKKFIQKLNDKLSVKTKYIENIDYPVDFRKAISMQISNLTYAIKEQDASMYNPIMIR